ncbi:MAG TPA: phosphoribosyl-AMP cyclohydrolase [Acidimicrobiales bacterium]
MTTTYTATPIGYTDHELEQVTYNADGLVPAIVQDATNSAVLMMAWMNEDSLRKTLDTGRTWFWSRSRQEYWCKGETSGDRQWVRQISYDCDGDTLLILVDQEGRGACHTGERSCFYRAFGTSGPSAASDAAAASGPSTASGPAAPSSDGPPPDAPTET